MLWAHFALMRACAGEAPEDLPARVAHSPCGEARAGTRSVGWSGAGAHSPRGEARRQPATVGGPARVHAPLREARRRTAVEGRPAGARSLAGGATPDCRGGRTGGCTLPYGRRDARLPWRADRRGCTLPCGRRDAGLPWRADRRGCTLPYGRRDAGLPWRAARRRCTLPYGRRVAGRAVEGGPAGARSLTGGATPDCREGRAGAGARSLAGGAEHRLPVAARDSTYVRNLTINPLDKACQVSSAPGIGRGARREGEGGRFTNRPYGRR